MASILDFLNQGQTTPDNLFGGYEDVQYTDPRTISAKLQQFLGTKPQVEPDNIQNILSQRFEPTLEDTTQGIVKSLGGKLVTGQDIADERGVNSLTRMALLAKIQNGGSGGSSVFAQTLAALNDDPNLAQLSPIEKIRIAQNKVGTNLTVGPDGRVMDMAGAAQSLGNLETGERNAHNQSDLNFAAPQASQVAIGKAAGEAIGNNTKKVVNAPQVLELVGQAKQYLPYATSGGMQAIGAAGKQFFNVSDKSTQADAQLDVISAGLLNNVPRMEGPQSDADRLSYERAAADVANRKKTIGDRVAALSIVEKIQNKYLNGDMNPGMSLPGAVNFNGMQIPQIDSKELQLAPEDALAELRRRGKL